MKFLLPLLALMLPASAIEPGFTPLFNGKDLSGWTKVNGNGEFKVDDDGTILGFGEKVTSNTFLRTEKTYKNFDYRFEMKFDKPVGNSGMMFRSKQKDDKGARVFGYQCEHDPSPRCWTAGFYGEAMPRGWIVPNQKDANESKAFTEANTKRYKPSEWNSIRILCEGNHIRIWLNDQQTVDYTDVDPSALSEGFFALQVHAGQSNHVRWRNVRIKEL